MKKLILIIVLLIAILGCQENKKLTIKPMIERINNERKYGIQFFEIDNHSEYPLSNLMDSILAYSEKELSKNNQMPPKVSTQYFYKETFFGACSDELIYLDSDFYEDGLQDCMEQSVALVRLFQSNDKKNDSIFNREIIVSSDTGKYVKDYGLQPNGTRSPDVYRRIYITRRDSILIKGTNWKILKKGRVEGN